MRPRSRHVSAVRWPGVSLKGSTARADWRMRSSTTVRTGFSSAAAPLAEAVNAAKNVTVDVGQVMFGQTFTVSLDVLRQYNGSRNARPNKSVIFDGSFVEQAVN